MPRLAVALALLPLACAAPSTATPSTSRPAQHDPADASMLQASRMESSSSAPEPEPAALDQPEPDAKGETATSAAPAPGASVAESLDVTLQCSARACDGDPWLNVEFTNPTPAPLTLDVPTEAADARQWTPSLVSAQWSDGSGFGSASMHQVDSMHHVPHWFGQPSAIKPGDTMTFAVPLSETRIADVEVEVEVSWREGLDAQGRDVRERDQRWSVSMTVETADGSTCAPLRCTISPLPAAQRPVANR